MSELNWKTRNRRKLVYLVPTFLVLNLAALTQWVIWLNTVPQHHSDYVNATIVVWSIVWLAASFFGTLVFIINLGDVRRWVEEGR